MPSLTKGHNFERENSTASPRTTTGSKEENAISKVALENDKPVISIICGNFANHAEAYAGNLVGRKAVFAKWFNSEAAVR